MRIVTDVRASLYRRAKTFAFAVSAITTLVGHPLQTMVVTSLRGLGVGPGIPYAVELSMPGEVRAAMFALGKVCLTAGGRVTLSQTSYRATEHILDPASWPVSGDSLPPPVPLWSLLHVFCGKPPVRGCASDGCAAHGLSEVHGDCCVHHVWSADGQPVVVRGAQRVCAMHGTAACDACTKRGRHVTSCCYAHHCSAVDRITFYGVDKVQRQSTRCFAHGAAKYVQCQWSSAHSVDACCVLHHGLLSAQIDDSISSVATACSKCGSRQYVNAVVCTKCHSTFCRTVQCVGVRSVSGATRFDCQRCGSACKAPSTVRGTKVVDEDADLSTAATPDCQPVNFLKWLDISDDRVQWVVQPSAIPGAGDGLWIVPPSGYGVIMDSEVPLLCYEGRFYKSFSEFDSTGRSPAYLISGSSWAIDCSPDLFPNGDVPLASYVNDPGPWNRANTCMCMRGHNIYLRWGGSREVMQGPFELSVDYGTQYWQRLCAYKAARGIEVIRRSPRIQTTGSGSCVMLSLGSDVTHLRSLCNRLIVHAQLPRAPMVCEVSVLHHRPNELNACNIVELAQETAEKLCNRVRSCSVNEQRQRCFQVLGGDISGSVDITPDNYSIISSQHGDVRRCDRCILFRGILLHCGCWNGAPPLMSLMTFVMMYLLLTLDQAPDKLWSKPSLLLVEADCWHIIKGACSEIPIVFWRGVSPPHGTSSCEGNPYCYLWYARNGQAMTSVMSLLSTLRLDLWPA